MKYNELSGEIEKIETMLEQSKQKREYMINTRFIDLENSEQKLEELIMKNSSVI